MKQMHAHFKTIRDLPKPFWVIIFASLLNQLGNMAVVFLILYLLSYLHFSISQSTIAFAVFSTSMCFFGLAGGVFMDRLGVARIMILSLLVNGLLLCLAPLLQTYAQILLFCCGWGATYGIYRPASQAMISHLGKVGLHKITFSIHRLAMNLGMSIGPALGGWLAYYNFPLIFYTNGIANLIACLILFIGLRNSVWFNYRPIVTEKKSNNIAWFMKDRVLRLFLLGMIPVSMVFFQHESTMAVFLDQELNLSMAFYGMLFTINTLIIVVCELPLNLLTLQWPYRCNFMLGSLLIGAGFAGMAIATSALHIILLAVVWTFGEMILYPACSSFIADIAPAEQRGSYMSLYSTCSNLGMMFGPWSGAQVMGLLGWSGLWVACGLWSLVSVVIFLAIPKRTA